MGHMLVRTAVKLYQRPGEVLLRTLTLLTRPSANGFKEPGCGTAALSSVWSLKCCTLMRMRRLDEAGSYCLPIPRKPLNRNSARTCDSRQHRHE